MDAEPHVVQPYCHIGLSNVFYINLLLFRVKGEWSDLSKYKRDLSFCIAFCICTCQVSRVSSVSPR